MVEQPVSFDTLPLELLFLIFDLSNNDSLLNVGKACHRLNSVAIPIFLQRVGIESPQESVFLRPLHNSHGDQLSGLTVDFSLISVKYFVCILNHPKDNPRELEDFSRLSPIAGLQKNIQRIHQFIGRLQSVGSVCLAFYSMGGSWSLRLPVVEDFLTALFQFIEMVTLKSCASLQILHPHPINLKSPYKFHLTSSSKIENIVTKGLRRIRDNELEGDGWKYQQVYKYKTAPSLSPSLLLGNELKTLELHTDFLFVPPFSLWTYQFLKHSQITALSLSFPTVISEEEFRNYIFPYIVDSLPGLLELRLAVPRDEFIASAIELIPRFPLLKKVTFGSTQYGRLPPPYSQRPQYELQLPALTTFTGYIDQATYLLGNASSPSLTTINLIVDDTRGRPNYNTISNKISALDKLFSGTGITPKINMCISNNGRGKHPPFPSAGILENSKREIDFSMVSRLTLELPISPSDDTSLIQQMEYIMEWLDIFTGLTDLSLTTRQPYHDSALLTEMILSEYSNIKSFNVVDYHAVFHYHWSSAPNDLRRNIDRRSNTTTFGNKSIEGCTCFEF